MKTPSAWPTISIFAGQALSMIKPKLRARKQGPNHLLARRVGSILPFDQIRRNRLGLFGSRRPAEHRADREVGSFCRINFLEHPLGQRAISFEQLLLQR